MDEWQVVAILDRSAGNSEVGEMWQETKVFDAKTPAIDILKWAESKHSSCGLPENFRGKLQLTVAQ